MQRPLDVVAGARPNFMKVAPILREMEKRGVAARLVHTGQHYDDGLSGVFFRELGIREAQVRLGVGSGSHGRQTAAILAAFEAHLEGASPPSGGVVVVGDVNSTMACALAAVKLRVPVAHVEAGLRSFDRDMPEEINRIVTDAISDLLLVSEPAGEENLKREGVAPHRIRYVGNVMIDSLVAELEVARAMEAPKRLGLTEGAYAYVTLHRPSNVDGAGRLRDVVDFLCEVAEQLPVAFPVHPRTQASMRSAGLLERAQRAAGLRLLEPLGYRESLGLMAGARLVVTDSGGIQEETSFLGIPCLTLRPNTERPVTVRLGTNTIVGEDLGRARRLVDEVLDGRYRTGEPIPGWDGRAAQRIVSALAENFGAEGR